MTRSMSAPEPFGTRASNISERSVDANSLPEQRFLYDFPSNPAEPACYSQSMPIPGNNPLEVGSPRVLVETCPAKGEFRIRDGLFCSKRV